MQAVSLSLFRFEGWRDRFWAFSQMKFAKPLLRALPDIGFFKLFGTGSGEGFTPVPNFGVYAVMATWPNLAVAQARIDEGEVFRRYRAHARDHYTLFLSATQSRGAWDHSAPFEADDVETAPSPVAVLTRATLKPRHLFSFWRHTPGISVTIRDQDALLFKIGMGEVPWLQQVTFSVWKDVEAMKAFAYRSASHAAAIRGVRENHWFKEELYARFRVLGSDGAWQGRQPVVA